MGVKTLSIWGRAEMSDIEDYEAIAEFEANFAAAKRDSERIDMIVDDKFKSVGPATIIAALQTLARWAEIQAIAR